ncbi:methyltransferase domain-containing protein (plasmid) [Skermanella mucosa]|uniref:class I SAM-dependent methyltransferase n=1 Tax=Skermanella mucosa TaxID=1789672 RepID=UPI00192AB9A2|nr:methyltransferase domain-containing protein [Skermanella mucosa]UEM25228.1 methyltransferase domain-containing protein [Skermanella mucosa]
MIQKAVARAFRTRFAKSFLSERTIYWLNVDLHFIANRAFNNIRDKAKKLKPNARYLNVACGLTRRDSEEWFNIDGFPAPRVDVVWDLTRSLPFEDKRFEGIYAEHFFEHLEPADAHTFLRECLRSLRPGGTIRISVPDGELYLRRYFEDRKWMLERRGGRFRTPMEVVNEVFRQGREHQFCYDFETLALLLREAGFVEVERQNFGAGRIEYLLIDQEARRFESLYVEGRRPT